ncbi:hypothetical protein MCOR27_001268 [Pyricularia oryzae]|uniref:Uncharacterized protein n=5 Tax=Pyricularia TaxID=48558 RepID=A0ABQ8NJQ9_PYRGI|nr:uncharacterized protein MGG_00947 [Pyricularia oryzae 70-15]ELQ33985.1 hypothetical protein OOU_Y34scaffold00832g12 [Pyricularia oryzae Y34]KAH8840397.1 hypothetical protein MCOR01_007107 [Pyricularia oryzae]KAI6296830.1 hypothetical protein MCOR33_006636 [Pyricularia grisea]EHA48420.1 hypothetical protein MGG_00947 [Pyricularia oryzae 70-15]KAH9434308.1 hypothetical protein MCOR02_006324 [Pyricularia oryzae]
MTRVTSMAKFTRLTASPSVVRPTSMASGASKASASLAHELSADGRSSDHESSRRGMMTTHGPARVQPNPNRTIPLMQSFFHSSPSQGASLATARSGPSTLDFTVLPNMSTAMPDLFSAVPRVPLLPDNFSPNRSAALFPAEVPDAPLPAPEISVIAQHPDKVFSALTEVEGIGIDGIELKFVHEPVASKSSEGGSMIRNVWAGL